jgi:hypothetical protein
VKDSPSEKFLNSINFEDEIISNHFNAPIARAIRVEIVSIAEHIPRLDALIDLSPSPEYCVSQPILLIIKYSARPNITIT